VRCGNRKTPLRIEDIKEVNTVDASAIAAVVSAVFPTADAGLVCSLRPRLQRLQLTSGGEAKQYPGGTGVDAFLRLTADAATNAAWLSATDAGKGGEPTTAPWLVAATSTEAYQQALDGLTALQLKPALCTGGVFTAGAVAGSAAGAVVILEIGGEQSYALLADRSGVRGVVPIGLNRDRIAEAVQTELGLKFRGSAGKLFLNPDYDFSETGGKIAARLADGLKAEIAPLLANRSGSTELYCSTLPAAQHWLTAQLAPALGLTPHVPDVKAWCSAAGVSFAPGIEATLSPAWLGALYSAHSLALAGNTAGTWQPAWRTLGSAVAAPAASAKPAPAPTPAPAPAKPATPPPAAKPATPPPAPAKAAVVPPPAPKPVQPPAPVKPTPPPAPVKPVPAPVPPKKGQPAPAPAAKTPPAPAPVQAKPAASSVGYSTKPEAAKSPTPAAPAKPAPVTPSATTTSASDAKPRGGKKSMILIGASVAVVVLVVGLFFYQSEKKEAARLAAEKQATEQRLQAEQERVRLAEQKAREEAEARQKTEQDLAQRLAMSESARQQAEQEARAQAAARLANARGTLEVSTEPAGATITVGSLPPRTSPATFADIRTGHYAVVVKMPRYEEVRFEVDVKENAVTTPPTVTLLRLVGTLEIASEPAGVDYEVRPANALMVSADARQTGRTPAKLEDLAPGEYTVTLTRDGWEPYSENVTIERDGTARVNWAVPTGILKVTSTPAGATIRRNGIQVGVAPLSLKEQAPGPVELELSLADYLKPMVVSGELVGGRTLELTARFPADERVYAAGEIDDEPKADDPKKIMIPYYLTIEKPRIDLELVVDRNGTAHNVRVVRSSSPDLPKPVISAVSGWRFKPAVRQGRPVNARMSLSLSASAFTAQLN
jgi:outer membrane biosynthesis protein TonB